MGGNVYRPIGMEWAEKGFWKVYDHPATQAQFLDFGGATPDGTEPVNNVATQNDENGDYANFDVFFCFDIDSGKFNKAITFDGFIRKKIDIVIASIPQHIEPFRRLCDLHPNKPKLIYQIGNSWNITREQASQLDAVMASAIVPFLGNMNGHNGQPLPLIQYHQEFDTDIFSPWDNDFGEGYFKGTNNKTVSSFINCFGLDGLFSQDWQLFQQIEEMMPDWKFKSFGGQCRDGAAHGSRELAAKMLDSSFIWHTKNGGDGYGHVLHNSAAIGRPLIIKRQYYFGKMGEYLIKDGETAIIIDGLSPQQIVDKINYYSKPTRYKTMCKNVVENFKATVDFDKEFVTLQKFISSLL